MIQPSIKIAPLGNPLNDQVVIFEEKVQISLRYTVMIANVSN